MSHLFKPLQRIGGEVVPLRMGQDILGQGREDGLEIGTLSSGSHNETMEQTRILWRRDLRGTTNPLSNPFSPRRVRLSSLLCLPCLPRVLLTGAVARDGPAVLQSPALSIRGNSWRRSRLSRLNRHSTFARILLSPPDLHRRSPAARPPRQQHAEPRYFSHLRLAPIARHTLTSMLQVV